MKKEEREHNLCICKKKFALSLGPPLDNCRILFTPGPYNWVYFELPPKNPVRYTVASCMDGFHLLVYFVCIMHYMWMLTVLFYSVNDKVSLSIEYSSKLLFDSLWIFFVARYQRCFVHVRIFILQIMSWR